MLALVWRSGLRILISGICIAALLLLDGCGGNSVRAPIVDGWQHAQGKSNTYIVQTGDTLYSIAWGFGLDYRDLARVNNLTPPYSLYVGERLRMVMPEEQHFTSRSYYKSIPHKQKSFIVRRKEIKAKPKLEKESAKVEEVYSVHQLASASGIGHWLWPTKGALIKGFSPAVGGNRGLDITGKLGQPIMASAAGRVVYSGSGLRGYGKLIIIKHSDNYLSAYAFNKDLFVKEGEQVRAGQVIAEMGQDDQGKTLLHFEIRQNGKPVNPLGYLAKSG